MPNRTDRPSRLRSYEAAPIPQFAIDVVHEFNRTISEELSPLREDMGRIKNSIETFQSDLRSQGSRLTTIEGNISNAKTSVKTTVWIFGVIITLITAAAAIFQIYEYFHPHS